MPTLPKTRFGFPYAERAQAAAEAHRRFHAAARDLDNRRDETDPATRRWLDGIADFHAAMRIVLPEDFRANLEALRAGDVGFLRSMVDFLVADPYFYGSGYLKVDVIRAIRRIAIPPAEAERLRGVVLHVLQKGDRREFRHYCQLARHVASPQLEAQLQFFYDVGPTDIRRRAGWMLYAVRQKP